VRIVPSLEEYVMTLRSMLSFALVSAAVAVVPVQAAQVPAYVAHAVADPARPATDTAQDANRKPAEVLTFTGIRPGDTVVDLMPGSGYYTRLFSALVGPQGRVFAVQPTEMDKVAPKGLKAVKAFAGTAGYANVTVLVHPIDQLVLPPGRVDAVWTSQNYHDLHDPFMGPANMASVNHAIFDALKSGGIFVVLDHAAAPGSGARNTNDLHRVDPALVKQEVTAAGFVLAGSSDVLSNPADDHTKSVFDPSIKSRTDKFILKFRKP
jgi:predicted methyltransferase